MRGMDTQSVSKKPEPGYSRGMARVQRDRIVRRAVTVATLCPWLLIVVATSLAAHFRLVSGHWPQPSLDDPKTTAAASLLFGAHYWLALLCIPLAVLSFLAPLLWLTKSVGARAIALSAVVLSVGWVLIWLDPYQIGKWILD